MANDIKTRMSVTGASSYTKQMRDAATAVKEMDSELALATEEFKRTGDKMTLVRTRSEILRREIKKQEEIVSTLEKAVKDASDKYGENSTQAQKWRTQLNNARATLSRMNTTLDNTEKGLDESGKAFDGMKGKADEADKALQGISFVAFDTAVKNITETAKRAAIAIANVGKSVWEMTTDSGKWADELATEAKELEVDPQTLQGWRYAAQFVDTEVDAVAGAISKVRKQMSGEEVDDPFGLDGLATAGKSSEEVFWGIIDQLHNMDNAEARARKAQEIFGKSYRDLLPLIDAGTEAWEGYVKEAEESGYVLDQDQIDKLSGLDDAIQRMETSAATLKLTISSSLAPAMETIAKSVTTVTDKLTEWANTDEGKKAIEGLGEAVSAVVETLTSDIDFNQIATDLSGLITSIGEAFSWAKDHPEVVLGGIQTALVGIASMKGLGMAINLFTAMGNLKNLTADKMSWLKGLGGGSSTGTPAPSATGTATGTATGAAAKGGLLKAAGGKAASLLGAAAPAIGLVGFSALVLGATDKVVNENQKARYGAYWEAEAEAATSSVEIIKGAYDALQEMQEGDWEDRDPVRQFFSENWKEMLDQVPELDIWERAFGKGFDPAKVTQEQMEEALQSGKITGDEWMDALTQFIPTLQERTKEAGVQTANGLRDGIIEATPGAVAAANNLGRQVENAMRTTLKIHSPSAVAEELGAYFGQGFGIGLENSAALIGRSMTAALSGISLRAPASQTAGGAGSSANMAQIAGMIVSAIGSMSVEIDGESAGRIIAPTVEQVMAEQLTSRRYA